MTWTTWVGAGLVACALPLLVYARHRYLHPRRELSYGWQVPRPGGMQGAMQAFGEAAEVMTWGTSLKAWRLRCEASLKASRARRGLIENTRVDDLTAGGVLTESAYFRAMREVMNHGR
jgi:hypothetical protein